MRAHQGKSRWKRGALIISGFLLLTIALNSGCTGNPFSDGDEINTGVIKGTVVLSDGDSPDDVYVWLEEFDAGTYTDSDGNFELTIPPSSSQGGGGGVDGDLYLYFYVANYHLDSSKVVFLNGEVTKSEGGIGADGNLRETMKLTKFLRMDVESEPPESAVSDGKPITVTITLQPLGQDTVVAFFLKMDAHAAFPLPALFLRKVGDDIIKMVEIGDIFVNHPQVMKDTSSIQSIMFDLSPLDISAGDYEIIPYIRVKGVNAPPELIDDFGSENAEYDPDYLNVPFKRTNGRLTIQP